MYLTYKYVHYMFNVHVTFTKICKNCEHIHGRATENKFGNIETQGWRRVICIFCPLFVFKLAHHACKAWGNNKEMSLSRRFSKTKKAHGSKCGNKERRLNRILQNKGRQRKECFDLIPLWVSVSGSVRAPKLIRPYVHYVRLPSMIKIVL